MPVAELQAQPSDGFTGRDFGGMRLPLSTVEGPLTFSASRAAIWSEGQFTRGGGGEVQRLLLVGDVKVTLGSYEFYAARASVWLERLDDSPLGPDRAGLYQVTIYFDRVGNPRGPASVSLAADRLPVRAVIDVAGEVGLKFDAMARGRPADEFLAEAEAVQAQSLRRMLSGESGETGPIPFTPPMPRQQPERVDPTLSRPYRSVRDLDLGEVAGEFSRVATRLPFGDENAPIFARSGVLAVAPGNLTYIGDAGDGDGAIIASDGVVVQYVEPRTGRSLQLQAQRAVVFLEKRSADAPAVDPTRLAVESLRGIYLEGDVVASDGRYTLRGPKIYYDIRSNKAVVLDAVFWTYDQERRLPLYVRAETIRQESQQEFAATNARFSTSAFFEPEFSLGAESVTIRRQEVEVPLAAGRSLPTRAGFVLPEGGEDEMAVPGTTTRTRTLVEASGVTLRAGDVPFFWAPSFVGDPEDVVLKDIRVENSGANGAALKTRWNLAGLLKEERTDLRQLDLLAQYYFDRGPAAGIDAAWQNEEDRGKLFAYTVVEDSGSDLLKPGTRRERDQDTRGMLLGEQFWTLSDRWTLFAEGSYIGDETFLDAFAENLAEDRREFTSQAYLQRRGDQSLFYLQGKTTFNDFIANEYLLQSKGYAVTKAPSIGYLRQADELATSEYLGRIMWWQSYDYSYMRLNFDEVYARERGFTDLALAQRAFGINPDQRISDLLRTQGFEEDGVHRFDTRQEFTAMHDVGPVRVEPFVVGRMTSYDDSFETYSPAETNRTRLWGSAGVRANTQIQRIDDSVESRFFDLHRMRHIVEPGITAWQAGTTVQRADLPVYDDAVENIAEGGMVRLGVDQTWQTERGSREAGKFHTVDVFKLNTDFVFASGDTDPKTPFGRWLDFRPELSNPGNFFNAEGQWQVSSALAITGGTTYDMDLSQQARSSAGFIIEHAPGFRSFAETRYLNPLDSTFLDLGASYDLTRKYSVAGLASYDLANGGWQGAGGELRRQFSAFVLGLNLGYNNVTDESSFGVLIRPTPVARKQRLRIFSDEPEPGQVISTGAGDSPFAAGAWR